MNDVDYDEFQGDQMNWKDDNGYVPPPGGRCGHDIANAVTWVFAFFNVALGVM